MDENSEIATQFNRIAEEYDANRRKFIPCFDEFYEGATKFVASAFPKPRRVLDLGAGTGLLTKYWLKSFPESSFFLTDVAEEMLSVARKRFRGKGNVSFGRLDYTETLPEGDFDAVISALSVHHLPDGEKEKLFARIARRLPEGGLFVNYDQFCADQAEINGIVDRIWEKQIENSGLSERDLTLWKERRKLDRECTVEKERNALLKNGFRAVHCIYTCLKFSVIVAIR
ncbi:MAG: class I SAM-dependent methyltransferase [Candidatus Gallimonas sp.]